MTGRTHIAVGVLAACAVTRPHSLPEIILCMGTAAVGALISDVDVTHSNAKNTLDQVIGYLIGAVVVISGLSLLLDIDLISWLERNSSLTRMLVGVLLFIMICVFGEHTPHRSFMHSVLGAAVLSFAVSIISLELLPYFLAGFASHLAIDMLNSKKVRLLYPMKGGLSVGLCKSDGLVNRLLFYIASAGSFGVIALLLTGVLR